jgi:hypothetical protein
VAESYTNITEGSGKKQHSFQRTIGANTVEDNVVVSGEPYLATYMATFAPLLSTSDSHLFQIMAGASLKVRIRRVEIFAYGAATTATLTALQLFRLTSAGTGGTAVTPLPFDPADSAAGATCMKLPTAQGTEAANPLWQGSFAAWQTMPTSAVIMPMVVLDFDLLRSKPIIIAAGTSNGVALKNLSAIAAALCIINVTFDETNF